MKISMLAIALSFLSLPLSANNQGLNNTMMLMRRESKEFRPYIKSIIERLIKHNENEETKLDRSYSFPKNEKESEQILNMFNPSKTAIVSDSLLLAHWLLTNDKNHLKKIGQAEMVIPIFDKFEIYKALSAAILKNKWSKKIKRKALIKWLLDMQTQNTASGSLLGTLIIYASLLDGAQKGLFPKAADTIVKQQLIAENSAHKLNQLRKQRPRSVMKKLEFLQLTKNKANLNKIITELLHNEVF